MLQKVILFIFLFTVFLNVTPPVQFAKAEDSQDKMVDDFLKDNANQSNNKDETVNNAKAEENVEEVLPIQNQYTFIDFLKMIFSFALVIGLIYFLLRFVNQRNRKFGQAKMLQNLGGVPLGTNRSIQIIRLGERILVVGVGENVQLLKELDSKEEVEEILEQQEAAYVPAASTIFDKLLKQQKNKKKQDNGSFDFQNLLKEQLDTFAEGRKQMYEKFKKKDED